MTVFRTIDTLDPFRNLAAERAFFESVASVQTGFHALLVWRNSRCVVIGRHQNPWIECDLRAMNAAGVPFARRVSGGGTVYHDPGNLNYSFVGSPDRYNLDSQFDVVIAALAELGIPAHRTERNDIVIGGAEAAEAGPDPGPHDGRKISGSAFRHTRNASLHHGTLLISADLAGLKAFLPGQPDSGGPSAPGPYSAGPAERGERTRADGTTSGASAAPAGPPPRLVADNKAIPSVRSRVANLVDVRPGLTFDEVAVALRRAYARRYGQPDTRRHAGTEPGPLSETESAQAISRYEEELRSWEWRFGKTPTFTLTVDVSSVPSDDSQVSLMVTIRHGRIQEVSTGGNETADGQTAGGDDTTDGQTASRVAHGRAADGRTRVSSLETDPTGLAARLVAALGGTRFDREEIAARAALLESVEMRAALAIADAAQ